MSVVNDSHDDEQATPQSGFHPMTPIVIAAVKALCEFEQCNLLEMGYDLSYAQEDLPEVVGWAIAPYRDL